LELLKEGMYARFIVNRGEERRYVMGQIAGFGAGELTLKIFGDGDLLRAFGLVAEKQVSQRQLKRCLFLGNSLFIEKETRKEGRVLCFSGEDERGFNKYFVQLFRDGGADVVELAEEGMEVDFTRVDLDVMELVVDGDFTDLSWWQKRYPVQNSLHTLKNAAYGFDALIGSRVFLHFHQVDTIIRAIVAGTCRFMLADEVGLGKTIEAGTIIRALKSRFRKMRTLVIVPESLLQQWKTELKLKFNLHFTIRDHRAVFGDLLYPLEKIDTEDGKTILDSYDWDLCIVDETHRLLRSNNVSKYNRIAQYSERVSNILLLSATPIQQRRSEYRRLLALLSPSRYKEMSESEFNLLLEKQDYLRRKINPLVRDLPDYLDDELGEDYLNDLQDVAVKLADPVLQRLLESIDLKAPDQGLQIVRLALAYVAENFQIEQRILRHRRAELSAMMPLRKLGEVPYWRAGAEYSFYELETYAKLLDYLGKIQGANKESTILTEYLKLLITAMFSSPWALSDLLNRRKSTILRKLERDHIKRKQIWVYKHDAIRTPVIYNISMFPGEKSAVFDLLSSCVKWRNASLHELSSCKELIKAKQKINGRLAVIIQYLYRQPSKHKYVIFSSFRETLNQLSETINDVFRPHATSVVFYAGKSEIELQQAVDEFQKNPRCRFLLCDELGGEGRNFQIAKAIIHVDIPWSPTVLEQRIGRLDRIGRRDDVESVVFYSKESIEEDLFLLWHKGLNIFQESLSGLEIALGDVDKLLEVALRSDLQQGLQQALKSVAQQLQRMKEMVERERHYDRARQLDRRLERQLRELTRCFESEEDLAFSGVMDDWAKQSGLKYAEFVGGKTALVLNNLEERGLILPNVMLSSDYGTFSRSLAVSYESLDFLGPGHPVFEAVRANLEESCRGRFCRAEVSGNVPHNWEGMLFVWSSSLDIARLLKQGVGLEKMALARGYMPLQHITTAVPWHDWDEEMREEDILEILLGVENGIRRNSLGQEFDKPTDWEHNVPSCFNRARQKALGKVGRLTDLEAARDDFYKQAEGQRAAALYFKHDTGATEELLDTAYEVILEGLKNPLLQLEVAVYVRLVKKDV